MSNQVPVMYAENGAAWKKTPQQRPPDYLALDKRTGQIHANE
jgi:hypothetical protein